MTQKIQESKNYGMFQLHEFNRDVFNTIKLEVSMKKHGWIDAYPMHVTRNYDGKLKIKEGHHRFEAAKKIGIAVKYVVCSDSSTLAELVDSTRAWIMLDHLRSKARSGNPNYIAIKDYCDETGIPVGLSISLIAGQNAGSSNHTKAFKLGTFKVGDPLHANQVKNIVLHMKKIGIRFASTSLFIQALSKVLRVDEFSIIRFKEKISAHATLFDRQPNLRGYLNAIELIYNRQSKEKIPLAFLADEKNKERQINFGRRE